MYLLQRTPVFLRTTPKGKDGQIRGGNYVVSVNQLGRVEDWKDGVSNLPIEFFSVYSASLRWI